MLLRLAILTSSSAPGLTDLLADKNRGSVFEISAVVSSETSFAQHSLLDRAGVPLLMQPVRPRRNLNARYDDDYSLAEVLARLTPDYVVLDGYRYITTEPLLATFPNRMIALHDADLTRRDEDGRRLFTGLHAVRDALLAGEEETRCSAFIVTEKVGEGPLVLLSGAYAAGPLAADARARGDADLLLDYAALHRRWMLADGYGKMLVRLAELLAGGNVQIVGDSAWIDGAPGPCRMGEAPSACRELPVERGIPASCPFISR